MTREEKLKIISKKESVLSPNMEWNILQSDKNGDWLNKGNSLFEQFIPIADKLNKINVTFFKSVFSCGLVTSRDSWCYNFSFKVLKNNINNAINFYNNEVDKINNLRNTSMKNNFLDHIDTNPTFFSWDRQQKNDVLHNKKYNFDNSHIFQALYRPFTAEYCYFDRKLNNCVYKLPTLFPSNMSKNIGNYSVSLPFARKSHFWV